MTNSKDIKKNVTKIKDDLGVLLQDFEHLMGNTKSMAVEDVKKYKEQLSSEIEDKIEKLQGYLNQVQDTTAHWSQELEDKTKENPWQMLLGAAGIGLILGLLIRRD